MAKARPQKKSAPKATRPPGPYLTAALIAEKLLAESDGVTSIVRIVDRIAVQAEGLAELEKSQDNRMALPLTLVIAFRAGGFRGKSAALILQEGPSGQSEPMGASPIDFDGSPDGGFNLKAPLTLKWEGAGRYWYNVYLDNKFVSRVPLTVEIGKLSPRQPSGNKRG